MIEMSAGLATKTNGQTALWLNGEPAWHHLGYVHPAGEPITLAEIMDKAGLDFQVEKRPLFWGSAPESRMGTQRVDRGQTWGIVRTDTETLLGTVGNVYEPFQ